MKIRKVDDKPMVIHTKEKAKIHAHEPKGAKIKGSNIYTVERGPKTAGAKVTDTDRKKSYRKSTIHQSESKNKGTIKIQAKLKRVQHFHQDQECKSSRCRKNRSTCSRSSNGSGGRRSGGIAGGISCI